MTNIFGLMTTSEGFPAAKAATVVAGCVVLFVAFKVVALALLSGALWWFLLKP